MFQMSLDFFYNTLTRKHGKKTPGVHQWDKSGGASRQEGVHVGTGSCRMRAAVHCDVAGLPHTCSRAEANRYVSCHSD